MNVSDFYFPKDLRVTKQNPLKILVVGSCLSEIFWNNWRKELPGIEGDFLLYNNASDLPAKSREELQKYDLQYVQIPLRSVLTDAAVRVYESQNVSNHDFYEIGTKNIDLMLLKALQYNVEHGLLSVVSNFIVPQFGLAPCLNDFSTGFDISYVVRKLNEYLANKVREYSNCFVADIDSVASSLGKMYFLDDFIGFSTHGSVVYPDWSGHERFPHWTAPQPGRIEAIPDLGETYELKPYEFISAAYSQVEHIYRVFHQVDMIKVVIFDLDNTLWRGQLIEHYQPGANWPYSDGWPLGIWEAIQHLRLRGIAIAICSKNDEDLVVKLWSNAVQPPFVKLDDFVIKKINWKSKAENINEILNVLSLTAKSALFVDDNPVERSAVKSAIPSIRTMGADPFIIKRVLLHASEMQLAYRSKETQDRERLFKNQIIREESRQSMSREDFLMTLETRLSLFCVSNTGHESFSRVRELTNKTNQFNTTGVRWDVNKYQEFFGDGGKIIVFSVADKFADYGVVGAMYIMGSTIAQFVMSCRVLGMNVELAALEEGVCFIRENGGGKVSGILVETESNTPCRNVFINSGFFAEVPGNYTLDEAALPKAVKHVARIRFDY